MQCGLYLNISMEKTNLQRKCEKMTHVELIERILNDYEKEWNENPSKETDVNAFRQGVKFAYNYLLTVLKNGDAWIYEESN